MSDSFIPLFPAASAVKISKSASFPMQVIAEDQAASAFQSLAAKVAAGKSLRDMAASSANAGTCQNSPRITVLRDGDRVTGIQVHCSCGQLVELDCVF